MRKYLIKAQDINIENCGTGECLSPSVKGIGQGFGPVHQKLEMEDKAWDIIEEEQAYIANDILLVIETLEVMRDSNYNYITPRTCLVERIKRAINRIDLVDRILYAIAKAYKKLGQGRLRKYISYLEEIDKDE